MQVHSVSQQNDLACQGHSGTAGSLKTTYFQVDDKFFQQKDGTIMGPTINNNFMEHFENMAQFSAIQTIAVAPDYTFVVWTHGPETLKYFFNHLNSVCDLLSSLIWKWNHTIPFLDVLVIRKGMALVTTAYRKHTHTGQYLNFKSNDASHVKRGTIHYRASTTRQE
jgi:hypothetical protein